jgi:hypothetical protein
VAKKTLNATFAFTMSSGRNGCYVSHETLPTLGAVTIYSLTEIFLLRYIEFMHSILSALAEPNHLHIVELLRDGPLPVGEIAN